MTGNSEPSAAHQVMHFLKRVAAADESSAVLQVVQDYLLAWPKERVGSLQRVDGGCCPFDTDRNPILVDTLEHLRIVQNAVHGQCLALGQANLRLTPELVELNEMLTIAIRFADAISTPAFEERSGKDGNRPAILNLL